MDKKDFNDFVSTLSDADIAFITDMASADLVRFRKEGPTTPAEELVRINLQISCGVLRLYHEWLTKDL